MSFFYSKTAVFAVVCFLYPFFLWAQPANSPLSIPQIMQGEAFVGYVPEALYWSADGNTLYFRWNPENEQERSWYKITTDGSSPQKVGLEEQRNMPSASGSFSDDRQYYLYSKNGDVFLQDLANSQTLAITQTVDSERNPTFADNGQAIVYQQGQNLFRWSKASGAVQQLTDFRTGKEPSEKRRSPQDEWLYNDQLTYFEVLKKAEADKKRREEQQEMLKPNRPHIIYLAGKSVSGQQLSPSGRFVTYRLTNEAKNTNNTIVPNYVTDTGYSEDLRARTKVGGEQDTHEYWIYDSQEDTTYQVPTAEIPGIYEKPAFLADYHQGDSAWNQLSKEPREVVMMGPVYGESDQSAAIVIRSLDNKDRWIMQVDLATGELSLIDRQRDEAWIGGPGISSWNYSMGNIGWLPDNETLWFQSEETGYSHLYTYNISKKQKKALTKGVFEVIDVQLSNNQKHFYLTTNQVHPGEQHFYKMPIKGGKMEQLTSMEGKNEVSLSPDEKYMAIRHSYSNKPWEIYLAEVESKEPARQMTKSTNSAFNNYSWRDPELVTFTAEDGAEVPARLYRPENPEPGGPAVIFVHGAGYLQNAHKWWSSYYREYMFHNFLVDNGYTVLDIDYRASQGYGRDWRTGIYRFMGGKDLSDQVDGARYLVETHRVDADKIGIYGGSYGGFITLMAMFNEPSVFRCGAALRSVADWAHYNHGYTSNILNTPVQDSIAYYKSSPIYHAEGLEGNLLILHGMIDVNVHFQDVVRLSQRLIELGKENWEMAVFPQEDHGFVHPSSWADEYRRIFGLFEKNLKE